MNKGQRAGSVDRQPNSVNRVLPWVVALVMLFIGIGVAWWLSDSPDRVDRGIATEKGQVLIPVSKEVESPVPAPVATAPYREESEAAHGIVIVRVFRPDGEPAPGETIKLVTRTTLDSPHRQVTNSAGEAIFVGVTPGYVEVVPMKGGGEGGTVCRGRVTAIDVQLPQGITLFGTVTDEAGSGIIGATVWLSEEHMFQSGFDAAVSGTGGYYEIENVTPHRTMSAYAEGYEPATPLPVQAEDPLSQRQRIDLRLGPVGSTILGMVRMREDQSPVAGAMLTLSLKPKGNSVVRQVSTDETGAFAIRGAWRTGAVLLECEASDLDLAYASLEFVIDEPQERADFEMIRGTTVRGTVRDEGNRPVAGAVITAYRSEDRMAGLRSQQVAADASGHFVMSQLSGERVHLRASKRPYGRDDQWIDLPVGATVEWDPILERGRMIKGRIIDRLGNGLGGWNIRAATSEDDGVKMFSESDADGQWVITNVPEGCAALLLSGRSRATPSWVSDVCVHDTSSSGEVTLTAGPAPTTRASIQLDEDLTSFSGRSCRVCNINGALLESSPVSPTGLAHFTKLTPGSALVLATDQMGFIHAAEIVVPSDSDPSTPISVRFPKAYARLLLTGGLPSADLTIEFLQEDRPGALARLLPLESIGERMEVPPGVYALTLRGRAQGERRARFRLAPGEDKTVRVSSAENCTHDMTVLVPKLGSEGSLTWRLESIESRETLANGVVRLVPESPPVRFSVTAPTGLACRILCYTDGGASAETTWTPTATQGPPALDLSGLWGPGSFEVEIEFRGMSSANPMRYWIFDARTNSLAGRGEASERSNGGLFARTKLATGEYRLMCGVSTPGDPVEFNVHVDGVKRVVWENK